MYTGSIIYSSDEKTFKASLSSHSVLPVLVQMFPDSSQSPNYPKSISRKKHLEPGYSATTSSRKSHTVKELPVVHSFLVRSKPDVAP